MASLRVEVERVNGKVGLSASLRDPLRRFHAVVPRPGALAREHSKLSAQEADCCRQVSKARVDMWLDAWRL